MIRKKIGKKAVGNKKKLPWAGFEITRVKLNPEQAVLSCCDTPNKVSQNLLVHCSPDACAAPGAQGAFPFS